jgi:hypothetical protein
MKTAKPKVRLVILVCAASLLISVLGVQPAYAADVKTYTVQRGDTMLRIATRLDINVNHLAAANDMNWNSWVYVGQKLFIPRNTGNSPSEATVKDLGPDPRVPDPLPELRVLPRASSAAALSFSYAHVVQDDAPVYTSPREATQGRPPKRSLGTGYVWVSVEGKTTYAGQDFYQINADEYVRAEALSSYHPSEFQGVALAEQPQQPFAWILKPVRPLLTPAGDLNSGAPEYQRYDLVQIFATERLGDQVWYLIGPHQWINQTSVGKVEPTAPPEGVELGTAWVEVDLFEQTLAAYVGEQMVYATLVSSGLPGWDTPLGLSKVWLKVQSGKMSGGYGRPDYYFLEDVPWTMYFNRDIALHTAYWHDGFGYRRSHGCVNLAPLDAKWLFEWAPETVWVWVH